MRNPIKKTAKSSNRAKLYLYVSLLGLAIFMLGCNTPNLNIISPLPTATPVVINFAVRLEVTVANNLTLTPSTPTLTPLAPTIIIPTVASTTTIISPISTPVASPLPLLPTPSPLPPSPSPTLFPTPTPTPSPSPLSLSPLPSPSLSPLPPSSLTPSPSPGAAELTGTPSSLKEGENIYTGPLTDQIVLMAPASAFSLLPGEERLEVKWRWLNESLPCQLPENFGFDIRIWPSPTNPNISPQDRKSIQPLGVIDAVAMQNLIAASCDPKSGTRNFTINNLSSTPGVRQGAGRGQFFLDVIYVQLKPTYMPLMASVPRDFFIQEKSTTPTP